MAKKAKEIAPASFEETRGNAELLAMGLDEILEGAAQKTASLEAAVEFAANELHAWEKLQAEIANKGWLVSAINELPAVKKLLPVDFALMAKQVELGVANANALLERNRAERDVDPMFQLTQAIVTHKAEEQAAARKEHNTRTAELVAEAVATNSKLVVEAKNDGRWATWFEHGKDKLLKQGILAAHKGLEKGTKASAQKCHAAFKLLLGEYLVKQGFRRNVVLDGELTAVKNFQPILEELADLVDPKRESAPKSGNAGSFKRGKGKANPKERHNYASGNEKPEVDVPSVEEANLENTSGTGESMGDFGFTQDPKYA